MGKRLYVGNLPYEITDAEVREWFAPVKVSAVDFIMDRETGRPRGFGFVEVDDAVDIDALIAECNGRDLCGRRITVSVAHDKQRGGAGGRARAPKRDERRHRGGDWD
jgi:RNA recognition motif-containing protein